MDRYPRVCQAFYNQVLALLPAKAAEIAEFLRLKRGGGEVAAEEIGRILAARGGRPGSVSVQLAGRVAVLPIMGIIAQRVSLLEESSGGVSTEEIGASLDGLVADRQVQSIVLAIDSPGGSVYGVAELAAKIRSLREQKQIVAIADSVAASAAYWIAAQASTVYVTAGGQLGSIGVLAMHLDQSGADEKAGIAYTLVTAGEHKAEGNPHEPLTPDARAEIQSKVDFYHGLFVADVAKGRKQSEKKVLRDGGQGRMLTAGDAIAAGLADGVATLEELVTSLAQGDLPAGGSRAALPRPRMDARLAKLQAIEKGLRLETLRRRSPASLDRDLARAEGRDRRHDPDHLAYFIEEYCQGQNAQIAAAASDAASDEDLDQADLGRL
jgi:signal peptide peptidase SppA